MNKINYDLKLKEILKDVDSLNTCPTLLLHSCCAPCSSYVLSVLVKHFDITIFYYNPNITDEEEYNKRLLEQKRFVELINSGKTDFEPIKPIKLIEVGFGKLEWKKSVLGLEQEKEGGKRCFNCYEMRLEKTVKLAKEQSFDYFGTTLSVSPYKNSEWLNQIGESLQNKYNVNYLFSDFKKNNGYKTSIELSKKYNLYRQNYCGCVYSKQQKTTLN